MRPLSFLINRIGLPFAVCLCPLIATSKCQTELHSNPLAGATAELERRLSTPITVNWQGVTLRQSADRLRGLQRLYLWVDRRLDPSIELAVELVDAPAAELFSQVSEQVGGKWTTAGRLIYVGPEQNVRELRTLLAMADENAGKLGEAAQARMLRRRELKVPRLAEPRDLVKQIASRAGVRVANPSLTPHDVWPEAQLPPMTTAAQLAFVLQGFDLTWRPTKNASAIEIVPIDRPVTLRRAYPKRLVERLNSNTLPAESIEPGPDASQVWFTGRLEDHQLITSRKTTSRQKPRDTRAQPGRQVYSLRVSEQPVGKVVQHLSRQLGKKLSIDPQLAASKRLEKRVSFEVSQVDLTELLRSACEPAGLDVVVEGDTIRLSEQSKP